MHSLHIAGGDWQLRSNQTGPLNTRFPSSCNRSNLPSTLTCHVLEYCSRLNFGRSMASSHGQYTTMYAGKDIKPLYQAGKKVYYYLTARVQTNIYVLGWLEWLIKNGTSFNPLIDANLAT